jgi:D-3-phosphoglycerate dehydrogenase
LHLPVIPRRIPRYPAIACRSSVDASAPLLYAAKWIKYNLLTGIASLGAYTFGCKHKLSSSPPTGYRMKIVITDHRFPDVDQERRAVESAGGTLVVGQVTDEGGLIELCRQADGVLAVRAQITRRVIEAMTRCKVIVRYGIGVDTIDIEAATSRGIAVANVPDYCVHEVSDHALALLLTLSRQIVPGTALAREDRWSTAGMPPLRRLLGQTCGLFGAGKLGLLLAAKVKALGMRVLACDPFLGEAAARAAGIEQVPFDELLATSDFISLHAPLTAQTADIFNRPSFERMKTSAFLINTARGGLIDEVDLLAALDRGEICGAALDVLSSETNVTPVRTAIVNHPRIVVTPHIAWLSEEARATLQEKAIAQVLDCLQGHEPYGMINHIAVGSKPIP